MQNNNQLPIADLNQLQQDPQPQPQPVVKSFEELDYEARRMYNKTQPVDPT